MMTSGLFGIVLGSALLDLGGLRGNHPEVGVALGCATHDLGTARAFEISQTAGAFASVSMGLSALVHGLPPVTFAKCRPMNSAGQQYRFAWRYLASRGLAPLAPSDPVRFALTRLASEADAAKRCAARDMAVASGQVLAVSILLGMWLAMAQATVFRQLAFRSAAAKTFVWEAIRSVNAPRRWTWARAVGRAIRIGQTEKALTLATASIAHQSGFRRTYEYDQRKQC